MFLKELLDEDNIDIDDIFPIPFLADHFRDSIKSGFEIAFSNNTKAVIGLFLQELALRLQEEIGWTPPELRPPPPPTSTLSTPVP